MKTAQNQFYPYYTNSNVIVPGNINNIAFDNQGGITVFINNVWRVKPGELKSLNQLDTNVIDVTRYSITFDPTDPNNLPGNNEQYLVVIATNIKEVKSDNSNGANILTKC